MVVDTCKYLINNEIPKSSPIHDPLVTSIFVLYGRPFKQKRIRLPEQIIPSDFTQLHKLLLDMRDKLYAHTDLDDYFSINGTQFGSLTGYTKHGNTQFGITIFTPELPQVIQMVEALQHICDLRARNIWNKYMAKESISDGAYTVNMDTVEGSFLKPHALPGGWGKIDTKE